MSHTLHKYAATPPFSYTTTMKCPKSITKRRMSNLHFARMPRMQAMCARTSRKRSIPTVQSHKKFSEGKQVHVGMEASKTNQTRWALHMH